MNKNSLLQLVEPLTFSQRFQRMVEFGRLSLVDAGLADVLAELEQGNFYERLLALQSCYGSRNGDVAFRALSDASTRIRAYAFTLVALFCNQEQQRQALLMAPVALRLPLLRSLRHHNLQDPVDYFLRELARQEDTYLGRYLAYGSPALVEQYLPQTYQRFNTAQWRRLARWQPEQTLSLFRLRMSAAVELDEQVVIHFNAVIPILALSRPDALLELLWSAVPGDYIEQLQLDSLYCWRPNELFDFLSSRSGPIVLEEGLLSVRLTLDRLKRLFQRQQMEDLNTDWLKKLPAQQRVELFQRMLETGASTKFVPFDILSVLPWQYSRKEAQRIWSLSDLSLAQMKQRKQYAQFLPWQEAMEHLQYDLHHSDAQLRGQALALLALSVRYQHEHYSDLLALFIEHRNEPDPAREKMLDALIDLSPGSWQAAHLAALGEFIQYSLAATDLSSSSIGALGQLLVQLLPFHFQWAAEQLLVFTQDQGAFPGAYFYSEQKQIEQRWRKENVQEFGLLLLPILKKWVKQDDLDELLVCAEKFGFRLRNFDGLAELLVQVLPKASSIESAEDLLDLLFNWRPDLAAKQIPVLLKKDPSWILVPAVLEYLQRSRQDLLTPFLDRATIQGRFSVEKTTFQLVIDTAHTLTQRQQETFARHLEQSLLSEDFDRKLTKQTTQQLAALPVVLPERLLQHIQSSSRSATKMAFINVLARADSAGGSVDFFLSLLYSQLEDGESTPLIHPTLQAFKRVIKHIPVETAFQVLTAQTFSRLMVQKELIFWLGQLPLSEAYWYLMRLQDQPDLHPDLRAAVIRALWNHLDRPETWDLLLRLAQDASSSMANKIGRISPEQLTPAEHEKLLRLLQKLLQHPTLEVRVELLQQIAELSIRDMRRILTPTLLGIIQDQSTAEAQAAASAFMTICTDRDIPELQATLHMLCQDRQRLHALVPSFSLKNNSYRSVTISQKKLKSKPSIARAMLAVMATYPLTIMLHLRTTFILLPVSDIIDLLQRLAESNQLHAEALMEACDLLKSHYPQLLTGEDLETIESTFVGHPDERLRRIALEALAFLSSHHYYANHWTPERKDLLQVLRTDSSPLVAEAAFAISLER